MQKIAVLIPVSESEPAEVIVRSARTIRALDYENLNARIVYVIDFASEDDNRISLLRDEGVEVLTRRRRGKRAGAVNDALLYLADFQPDYVALFDVDSRPSRDFITKCVHALERDPRAYIASAPRAISNPLNLVSRTIQAEYHLLNLLLTLSAFKQFNGLIGVLRADLLYRYKLDEEVITEDADYATRLHAEGYTALLVTGTTLYEQAPLTWLDLFRQRTRWYYGGLQLWRYQDEVKRSKDRAFVHSWMLALTLPYGILLFLPLVICAPLLLFYYSEEDAARRRALAVFAGFLIYLFILQFAASIAFLKFLRGRGVAWQAPKRVVD